MLEEPANNAASVGGKPVQSFKTLFSEEDLEQIDGGAYDYYNQAIKLNNHKESGIPMKPEKITVINYTANQ